MFFLMVIMASCHDEISLAPSGELKTTEEGVAESGMQRIIVNSRSEIEELLENADELQNPKSRASLNLNYSNNEEKFISLLEANKQKVMSSLTQEQLNLLKNDPEEPEYSPSDSIIADIQFACLLNADREIQINDSIYKYLYNGVAIVPQKSAKLLKKVESETAQIDVTPENAGKSMSLENGIKFIPMPYKHRTVVEDYAINLGGYHGGYGQDNVAKDQQTTLTGLSTKNGISLSNGVLIPNSDIRNINYSEKGDGDWFHRTWTGLWGRNVVAINHFSDEYKLTMNFYDQNYIVYANIGTKLKMQKQVFGIWWNIKTDTMIQGWETIALKYDMPSNKSLTSYEYLNYNPSAAFNQFKPFPYTKNAVLLTLPFIDYDLTERDLYKAFAMAVEKAMSLAHPTVKEKITDGTVKNIMLFNNKDFYIIHGPYCMSRSNVKSIETKVQNKWFPGTYEFAFNLSENGVKFGKIKVSGNDGVSLYRGSVFGAIKFHGRWLGARIIKDKD